MKTTCIAFLVSACTSALCADVLDELMPVPRRVVRGEAGVFAEAALPGAYRVVVKEGETSVEARDAEGLRYASATIEQLKALAGGEAIPDCTINDWPEFKYRGVMLDCGRNYQSVESILDLIDHIARYKMNVFHWHLADIHGWRLESKVHPELQQSPQAFTRQVGKFYTQEEFRFVLRYAKSRGVMTIPEIDMPGHTRDFRKATGLSDLSCERAKIVLGELIDELCSLASAEDMPIIHLGTDEVREPGEKVPQGHLDYWAEKVVGHGRRLMGWSPGLNLKGQSVKHLWRATDMRGDDCAYIDSQCLFYINHVDPEELLFVACSQKPCRWGSKAEKLGAIMCVWHDDCIADTEDVARMNSVYPAVVLFSDIFWRGRERDEQDLYGRLPAPDDPRFALAADMERRLVAQRDKVLRDLNHPFPYVPQTMMRWRMSDESGKVLATDIPQATVYPRHFWYNEDNSYVKENEGTVVLETWITSPREMDCGAWIGATGFSRSNGRTRDQSMPALGQWNCHGAKFELNGEEIAPPKWAHPGLRGKTSEIPFVDEGYSFRPPTKIHLRKGVNHVKATLPKKGGWKWIGTFVPVAGDSDHPREVEGLVYSSSDPSDTLIPIFYKCE